MCSRRPEGAEGAPSGAPVVGVRGAEPPAEVEHRGGRGRAGKGGNLGFPQRSGFPLETDDGGGLDEQEGGLEAAGGRALARPCITGARQVPGMV